MAPFSKQEQVFGLIVWLVVSFAASAIGAVASLHAGEFYTQLARPDWAPPPAIFGPVWTVLYGLMGIAAWYVWRVGGFGANRLALGLFMVQLSLNALWTWLFFSWRLGLWAFVDILLLLALILATLVAFWRVRLLAGVLLIPYLLWVVFAAALNYSIWQLNLQVLS
jgi:tryptophan-rich sensory protein